MTTVTPQTRPNTTPTIRDDDPVMAARYIVLMFGSINNKVTLVNIMLVNIRLSLTEY